MPGGCVLAGADLGQAPKSPLRLSRRFDAFDRRHVAEPQSSQIRQRQPADSLGDVAKSVGAAIPVTFRIGGIAATDAVEYDQSDSLDSHELRFPALKQAPSTA